MPRPPRCDAPGAVHHVWARGIDGRAIFVDDGDRFDLLHRLARILPESEMRCLAWALMSNHVHLVLRAGRVRLSTVMKRVHTGFALRFNRRNERRGYLFQSRFGSRVVRNDADLAAVIGYVLRNPLEGGLVRSVPDLEHYRWTSLPALTGRRHPFAFESVRETLAVFAEDPLLARRRLLAWVARAPSPAAEPAASLEALIRDVCRANAVDEAALRDGCRARAVSAARALVCRRAVDELGLAAREVARALAIAESTVSMARRRPSNS